MWISKAAWAIIEDLQIRLHTAEEHRAQAVGENDRIARENERMRSDIDWFKLRLNQVEKERAQLILASTGHPISVPTFTPAQEDPSRALQEMPDFAMVGADAPDDYTMMPKRDRN